VSLGPAKIVHVITAVPLLSAVSVVQLNANHDAQQGRRDRLPTHRRGPSCLPRHQIHETFRLCCLAWVDSCFSWSTLFLGSVVWCGFMKREHILTNSIEMADPTNNKLRTPLKLGGFLGFTAGFLFAYQRSSSECLCMSENYESYALLVRFWGWSENKREEEKDLKELSQLAKEGKPLYGTSPQPAWVQTAASANSQWSQLKFCEHQRFL